MRWGALWILPLALPLAVVVPARANPINLVTDPGFESCVSDSDTPPGWSGTALCYNSNPHTGNWDAFLVAGDTLSQTITTIAGASYDFSFWLASDSFPSDTFTASFGSDEVLDLTSFSVFGYTLEDFTVTATGTATTIEFFTDSDGYSVLLDDVSVTQNPSTVPEPATLPLIGSGLLGLWWFRRRRASK